MATYQYHWVDVFTDRKFGGNQLAVFPNAEGLDTDTMQALAREMNLSETTFVFPPEDPANTYRVRIFTPAQEMMMAGHPTIGTAFVLHRLGMLSSNSIRFEENVGVIPVDLDTTLPDNPVVQMTQPVSRFFPTWDDRASIAELLSLPVEGIREDLPMQVVTSGVPFFFVPLRDLATIQQVKFRVDVWERLLGGDPVRGLFAFTQETLNPNHTVHSRMFAPPLGIVEDPATGAASGPLGAYLVKYGLVTPEHAHAMVSEQGFEMGRPSLIYINIGVDANGIIDHTSIGGTSVYIGNGTIEL